MSWDEIWSIDPGYVDPVDREDREADIREQRADERRGAEADAGHRIPRRPRRTRRREHCQGWWRRPDPNGWEVGHEHRD